MSLLYSNQIKEKLAIEIAKSTQDLQIISAYCKENALTFFDNCIINDIKKKRLLVRFTLDDIISGASDLFIYEYCKQNAWQMYVRFDLHAKTYIFDNSRCIVGSANLTSRGIGINIKPNHEIATIAEIDEDDRKKINSLFDNALKMSDELYAQMKKEICSIANMKEKTPKNWSEEILSQYVPDFSVLFSYDLPRCNSPNDLGVDSLDFLDIPLNSSIDDIKTAFLHSKIYLWLLDVLTKNNNEMYFGALSSCLHDALVNDPKPYRKEVKELQQNLLNWIIELDIESIEIDIPSYSQRIKYIN